MLCKLAKSLLCVLCVLLVSPRYEAGDLRNKPVSFVAEPTYAGRGLRGWTARLDDPNPFQRAAAARALGAIGPDARASVPDLIRTLGDDDSSVRTEAAMALGRIGPAAAAAAPEMLATLRQASYFDSGMIGPSLAGLGPAAVPLLLEATRDRAGNARSESIRALRLIGPGARAALGRLEELARDPKDPDRVEAAFGLWSVAHSPEAISLLADALADQNEYARTAAAVYLGSVGPEAKPAVPALIRVLSDRRFTVRGGSATALGKIGAEAKDAIPAILHAPGPAGPGATTFAIPAAAIGPAAVPALIEGLGDPDDGPRWTAAEALGRIGPRAQAAVPALTRMSTSANLTDRVIAATALWRIARDNRVVPLLVEAARPADGRDLGNRYAALDALAEIGPAAAEAVPALIKQLAVENDINAYKVVDALGKIGPAAGAAIEPLERISAHSQNESLRMSANLALWRMTKGEKGLGALIKELKDGDNMAKDSALMTLGQIGREAAPAVPTIAELLRNNPPDLSLAVGTLRKIGPPAKSTLPVLIQIFNDDALLYKDRVGDAIRAIDPAVAKSLGIR
jgi:HEAT repeat protein